MSHINRETEKWRNRYRVGFAALLLAYLLLAAPARAQGPVVDVKRDVTFDQKPDAQVPLDLVFRDDQGQTVKLGDYVGDKPVILTLNYFHCPNSCSLALDQLTQVLADLKFNLGDEYAVVTVSIDPRETPAIAADKKWGYVRDYGRPGRGDGWHFLTGDKVAIDALAQAVGFHYVYDPRTDEFAHPIGLMVLTPQGRISRYIFGTDYAARDIQLALVEASQNKIGSVVDQLLLVCYHYDPSTGRYSVAILEIVQWASIAMVVLFAGFIGWLWKSDPRRKV
jgi:protein SCO1/2